MILRRDVNRDLTHDEVDSNFIEAESGVQQAMDAVEAIGSGEGGKMYDTLAEATEIDPAPIDGTIFQVSEKTDPDNAGVYSFQSGEPGGTRFEREPLDYENIASKAELDQLRTNLYEGLLDIDFVNGSIRTITGEETDDVSLYNIRLRSTEFIRADSISIRTSSSQEATLFRYNEDKEFLGFTDYSSFFEEVDDSYYIRIVVKNKDDSQLTPRDNSIMIYRSKLFLTDDDLDGVRGRIVSMEGDLFNTTHDIVSTEQGTFSPSNGSNLTSDNDTTVRTSFLEGGHIESIYVNEPNILTIIWWDESGQMIDRTDYANSYSNIALPENSTFRVAVTNSDNNIPITPEDVELNIIIREERYALKRDPSDSENIASKAELDQLRTSLYEGVLDIDFVNGSIRTITGEETDDVSLYNIRLRSTDFIRANSISIKTSSSQEAILFKYNEDKEFLGFTDYSSSFENVNDSYYIRPVVRNKDESPITPEDNSIFIYRSKLFLSDDDLDGVRERIEVLEDNLFNSTHEIVSTEQGTFSPSGGSNLERDTTVRTRFLEGGFIESIYVNQPNVLTVYWWDEDRQLINQTGYANSHSNIKLPENSTFRVAVRHPDSGIPITPEDVVLNIIIRKERYALKGSGSGSSSDEVFTKYQPPLITSAPHGETLGYTFQQKQDLFEQILDDYPGTWTKEDIGPSYNGLHRVNAYTLTPESYTVTIAITSHVHGNERHNPTGFYALLSMVSDTDLKHSFFNWIKENVRWIVVPFVSPIGYINNSRNTDGFNLNRNMDYDWAQLVDNKGDYPMSCQENQNIANFFMPIREEIDFHLDTHDIPSSASISYWIHQQEEFIWLREQEFVEDYLIRLNETNKRPSRYIAQGGTYTQYFTEVLGIPSMTPEHSTSWWEDYPADVQIAKATEQLAALVCMFANVHEERKGAPFYNKLIERSFCSEEFGISTWTSNQLETYFTNLDGWEAEDEFEGLMSYTLEPSSYTKTILVLSGITPDDKNSAFTSKTFMEEIIKEGDKLPMYVRDLKNVRIVVVPVLNGNPFFVPENELENIVNGLQAKYSPDYSLVIRGVENDAEPDSLVVRSVNSPNLTRWSQENIENVVFGIEGIENYMTGRYSVAILNNPFENAFKYAHGVVQWVELITNDLASFNKEK